MYNYRPAKRGHQQPHQQQHQQPGKQFANEKRQALVQKLDRSRKGELDELVQPLCDLINADARYYTTSSCSGRLTLCGLKKKEEEEEVKDEEEEDEVLEEGEKKKEKNGSSFCSLFDRHKAGHYGQEIISSLKNAISDTPSYEAVDLKFEPVIFHVRAVDLEAATALLQVALQAGFRNSGIVTTVGATEHSSCIVALRHTLQMAVPVVVGGVMITPDEYIHKLVNVANGKFAANEAAIARLEADIRDKLYTSVAAEPI